MPDWRGFAKQPLTDSQVTDIVAWLSSQRKKAAGQLHEAQAGATRASNAGDKE
jgi:hypothetical protein